MACGRAFVAVVVVGIAGLVAVLPAGAGAVRSLGLVQLAGGQGCIAQPEFDESEYEYSEATGGCGRGRGLIDANGVVVSGDGRHVYVAAGGSGAVSSFARDGQSGEIVQVGCVSANGTSGVDGTEGACVDGDALAGASSVTASPDGRFVYATSYWSSGIAVFARAESGRLRQVGCVRAVKTCVSARALGGAAELAISPDGRNAYLAAPDAEAVVQFTRDPQSGALAFLDCISDDGTDRLCKNGNALRGAAAIVASPDGKHVYVAAATSNAVLTFVRDGTTGALRQTGCVMDSAPRSGSCVRGRALGGVVGLALTSDGRTLFATAYDSEALAVFSRNPVNGSIREVGCVSVPPYEDEPSDGCEHWLPLSSPSAVAVTRDGKRVYVSVDSGLTAFSRDPVRGGLEPLGCLTYRDYYDEDIVKRCALASGIASASDVAVSPDGRNVYVTSWGSDAVAVFAPGASFAPTGPPNGHGTLSVQMTCPRLHEGACSGSVTLRVRTPRRTLQAVARYALDQGRSGVVRVRLTRPLKAALGKSERELRGVLTATDGAAPSATFRRHVVLRRPLAHRPVKGPAARASPRARG